MKKKAIKKLGVTLLSLMMISGLVGCASKDQNEDKGTAIQSESIVNIETSKDIEISKDIETSNAIETESNMGETEAVESDSEELEESIKSSSDSEEEEENKMIPVRMAAGSQEFDALFYDNETTREILSQMPLTIEMADFNRNEKIYHFPQSLPVSETITPGTIHAGELMCWSSDNLVLFYETFSSSYGGYVRLGYIENIDNLKDALGDGDVTVTFTAE